MRFPEPYEQAERHYWESLERSFRHRTEDEIEDDEKELWEEWKQYNEQRQRYV